MKVGAVDERHVDRHVPERPRTREAAEPGADDDDARPAHDACGFRNLPPPLRRRLAILSTAVTPPVASSRDFGSFCFFFATGSNRSPSLSTRFRTWSESKTSRLGFLALRHFSTSSHVTGVDTVGRARARS